MRWLTGHLEPRNVRPTILVRDKDRESWTSTRESTGTYKKRGPEPITYMTSHETMYETPWAVHRGLKRHIDIWEILDGTCDVCGFIDVWRQRVEFKTSGDGTKRGRDGMSDLWGPSLRPVDIRVKQTKDRVSLITVNNGLLVTGLLTTKYIKKKTEKPTQSILI